MERHRKQYRREGKAHILYVSDRLRREAVDPELMKEVENILRKRQMSKKIIICLMLSFQPFNIHY